MAHILYMVLISWFIGSVVIVPVTDVLMAVFFKNGNQ